MTIFEQSNKRWSIALFTIVIVAGICLFPTLFNGTVNYDDDTVVFQNPIITNFSFSDIVVLFKQGVGGNYHPLTTISFILNYKLSGESPFSYHIFNLILHLFNTILVFVFIRKLTDNNFKITLITALFFGIHPMHVESVAWIVERKDVLFAFFYLFSMIFYISYTKNKSYINYILFTFLGVLSLLSKPAAVTLPIALILIDYFQNNKITLKDVFSKTPLFLGAFFIGIATVFIQKDDALSDLNQFSILEKLGFGCYALSNYIIKSIMPIGFSVMHPYPQDTNIWMIKLIISVVFVGGLIFFLIKKGLKNKFIVFGSVFFVINLVLVLQFVSVGRAIFSERYSYLPYIGLFFVIGFIWDEVRKKNRRYYQLMNVLLMVLFVYCAVATFNQSRVWESSQTLWSKVIKEYPDDWYAYIGRGNFYRDQNELKKAIADYNVAIKLYPRNYQNYFNRGDVYKKMNRYQKAIADYNKAIAINPNYVQAYINRGQYLSELQRFDEALLDFNKAIDMESNIPQAYINRGNVFLAQNKWNDALEDYNKAISLNDDLFEAWYNRGNIWLYTSNYDKATSDFTQAITIAPTQMNAYNNLANAYYQKGELPKAIQVYGSMIERVPSFVDAWYNRSIVYFQLGNKKQALKDAIKAKSLGKEIPQSYFDQLTTP